MGKKISILFLTVFILAFGAACSSQSEPPAQDISNLAIELNDAIEIFEREFPNTELTSIEMGIQFGTVYYEMEGIGETHSHELRLNSGSGNVDRRRSERLDLEDRLRGHLRVITTEGLLSVADIVKVIREAYPEGTIREAELQQILSQPFWIVEISTGLTSGYYLQINALTGELVRAIRD